MVDIYRDNIQVPNVKFIKLREDVRLPTYATPGSSGADIYAPVAIELFPLAPKLVKCGFSIEMQGSIEGQIRPRSGLALKHGITVLNTPGTIDADYRGEVGVILLYIGGAKQKIILERGERIAQLVFAMRFRAEVLEKGISLRGEGGFGSTGA
jgi:dUTP pyrophosphatase